MDGIEDTESELVDLENNAKKRVRAINAVMGTPHHHYHQGRRARNRGRGHAAVDTAAANSKSRLNSVLDSATAALSAVSASLNESPETGFTLDARYQNDAMGELDDQFLSTLECPPCLQPSNFSYYGDYDIHGDTNYGVDGISGLPGSPEKPIVIDDDDYDPEKNLEKAQGIDEGEEDIRDYQKYFQEPVSPSPVVSDNDESEKNRETQEKILDFLKHAQEPVFPASPVVDDNNENLDPLSGSLQDYSPSIMRLDRRRLRRVENSPEFFIPPGNVTMSKLYRDAEAAVPISTISDSDSDIDKDPLSLNESSQDLPLGRLKTSSVCLETTFIHDETYRDDAETTAAPTTALSISNSSSSTSIQTIQEENPISSNSSSPNKKRVRNEQEDDEDVKFLGEVRCKKSPKRDTGSEQTQSMKIEPISIED